MKAYQKKIISALICAVLLLSAGCKNIPDETSANLADETTETTASETSTTETTTTETTELRIATVNPDDFPENIYLYHFDCEPLHENIDPEQIKITLQKDRYSTQDTSFRVHIFNKSSEDIEIHTVIFLEKYMGNGTDYYGNDYYPGWMRIPFDPSSYSRFSPPKIPLSGGNDTHLTFYSRIDDTNCLLESESLEPGKYRFVIYMSGGPRYVEFEITEND